MSTFYRAISYLTLIEIHGLADLFRHKTENRTTHDDCLCSAKLHTLGSSSPDQTSSFALLRS